MSNEMPAQENLFFRNDADGVESFVVWNRLAKGWGVGLKDLDSGETLPEVRIYPNRDVAIAKAKKAANV